MEQIKNEMTISELSNRSAIPISTIKFYLRKELIPRPVKARGTRAYYTAKHIDRLKLIKKIQQEGNMPLDKIKGIISLIDEGESRSQEKKISENSDMQPEIIRSATALFREKGYEQVTIADIVEAARIGRSTFYKHFKNKKELFIECIKKIIFKEMEKVDSAEIEDETDILNVFDKHAKTYYSVNPLWIDMVDQLRAAAINDPDEFAGKLDEVICLKINLLKRGVENGIQKGLFRNINALLLAVMLLGIQDYSNYLPHDNDEKILQRQYEDAKDIILHGILNK